MTAVTQLNPRTLEPGKRCLCLGRVSTKKQAREDKISLPEQVATIRAFALKLGAKQGFDETAIELWEDPGVSGLDEDRLEEIVSACEREPQSSDRPGSIVVFDMSRFTRLGTMRGFGYLDRLNRAGWRILDSIGMLEHGYENDGLTLSQAGAFIFTSAFEVASGLAKMLKLKVPPGMCASANQGKWVGGPKRPFGYVVDPATQKLVFGDPTHVAAVRAAFKSYLKGATLQQIADDLSKSGKRWNPSGVRALLANPAYVGDLVWGRRAKNPAHRGGMVGAHDAIIDRTTWEQAQARLQTRGAKFAHGATRPAPEGALPYVLSKRIRCSCGGGMLVGGGGVPSDATEAERLAWRSYQCKACRSRVGQAALERSAYAVIAKFFREDDADDNFETRAQQWIARQMAAGTATSREAERKTLLAKKERLLKLAGEVDDPDLGTKLSAVKARLAALDGTPKPNLAALKKEAARFFGQLRQAFTAENIDRLTPADINLSLTRLLPLFVGAEWDRETRQVEISLRINPSPDTKVGIVPHSGYNASWRVRA